MTGVPDISFTDFEGEWTLEAPRKKPKFDAVEDEIEEGLRGADDTPEGRTVQRIMYELTFLNPRRRFRYSRDQMLIRLVRIQDNLQHVFASSLSPKEIEQRANSIFLLQCVHVLEHDVEWDQLSINKALKF
jgi:hypothetical protein